MAELPRNIIVLKSVVEKYITPHGNMDAKFVGDGKVILSGFCPDFINKIQKKIIELYGDYWHTKSQYVINKDKRRLIEYKKRGYKTLIIWEHELKDLDKITNKLIKFTV